MKRILIEVEQSCRGSGWFERFLSEEPRFVYFLSLDLCTSAKKSPVTAFLLELPRRLSIQWIVLLSCLVPLKKIDYDAIKFLRPESRAWAQKQVLNFRSRTSLLRQPQHVQASRTKRSLDICHAPSGGRSPIEDQINACWSLWVLFMLYYDRSA